MIEQILAESEQALLSEQRPDLTRLGFWKAVAAVKRDPQLTDRYADRIARIDRDSFLRRVPIVLPAAFGVVLEFVGTAVGIAILVIRPLGDLSYLIGAGAIIGASHALTHWIVGSAMGIRFTHFFAVPPLRPQPGFKTDYATYLRTPARSRAWMHASGAIVSKIVPFAVAAMALGRAESWVIALLLGIGVVQLISDVTLSTRASDWKRFRREMRAAR